MSVLVVQTKLPSYLPPSYLPTKKNDKKFSEIFFRGENKATKLPTYRTKNFRFHPYNLPYLGTGDYDDSGEFADSDEYSDFSQFGDSCEYNNFDDPGESDDSAEFGDIGEIGY